MWRIGREGFAGIQPVLGAVSVGAPAGQREYVLAQAHPGAVVEDSGCSINLEPIEDHTDSCVAVEAARVVLHQFEPVKPY